MNSIFSAPYDLKLFRSHALFYVALQVIIWIKVFFFYSLYGHGYFVPSVFVPFIAPHLLAAPHLLFDYVFHQVLHFLILIALFLFARRIANPNVLQLIFFFAVAVFLHNVGYWFTNSYDSFGEIVVDAALDFALLFILFYAVRVAKRFSFLSFLFNAGKRRI